MTTMTIIALIVTSIYIGVLIYALRHQNKPFWRGFVNPFGF